MKIKELQLYSARFEQQILFYAQKIGLELLKQSEDEAVFQVGRSKLVLKRGDDFRPYHFAINIPANQENEALGWLKQRVKVLRNGEDEIHNFTDWNARAIYFYDEDKNIVEFIARKNLPNSSQENFSSNSLLEISEIGMPVDDIEAIYNTLSEIVKVKIYDGSFARFCALGDENGLFICINKHRKSWFPTGDKAYSAAFTIDLEENGGRYKMEFKEGLLKAVANTS